MSLADHIETNPHSRIVLNNISWQSDLWSNLLRKTAVTITLCFPAEEEIVSMREK